jgi:4-diphosphocytidyl-2C-methyl-D-erythritol kinase
MAELLVSAPAKINLHLEVLGLRPDGFHELAMVMQTLDLADTLRLRPTADGAISLRCDHADLPTDCGPASGCRSWGRRAAWRSASPSAPAWRGARATVPPPWWG